MLIVTKYFCTASQILAAPVTYLPGYLNSFQKDLLQRTSVSTVLLYVTLSSNSHTITQVSVHYSWMYFIASPKSPYLKKVI